MTIKLCPKYGNTRHKHVIDGMEDHLYYTVIRELQGIIKIDLQEITKMIDEV